MARPPAHVPPPPKSGPPAALIAAVLTVAVMVVAVIVYVVLRPSDPPLEDIDVSGPGSSANALPDAGGIRVGEPAEGAPSVEIYEDFQCPGCGLLEATSGTAFTEAAEAGEIELTYTLMSFMDRNLDNDSSTRATNAALCADDLGAFVPYHREVFAGQPEEGDGWSDDMLVAFAEQAGVDWDDLETFRDCLEEGTHNSYVEDMQIRANQDGVTGTPNVFIDGTQLPEEELLSLIEDPDALETILASDR